MNLQLLFPVTLPSHWQSSDSCELPDNLQSWLLDPDSLTARLKTHCHQFRVELLGQKVEHCQAYEAVACIPVGEKVLVREVLLYCDDKPQVFARSLLPMSSLTGAEQALANLGTQSLGQVLFNNPSLERKFIEVATFDSTSSVAKLACDLQLNMTHTLWGRRSVFVLENKPLMVAEVFLPGAFSYQTIENLVTNPRTDHV
ncbi:chorismate--pyruvate lyase family protein [Candidatus Colwellia aromaticivorans]|uniref:chorismate--pyruvate lyase family protein n=1 Tax=Candidatus Colwellia aromaticivorans TaxID=2267621 RepID=UPI000DF4359D|nr:chorismate lyase [Candidatus Colwellia aromaticivorans]